MNIAHHVERGRRAFPGRAALVFDDQELSYADLDRLASQVGNTLCALGVGASDRVALLLPNIPEFVISYLGVLKIGAIVVSMNTMLKRAELEFLLQDCDARIVITTAELRQQLPEYGRDTPWRVITVEGDDDLDFARLVARASVDLPAVDVASDTPAAIVYTSGTTGVAKGATLSHGNVVSNMIAKNVYCGTGPDDRLLLFLPLFHCFGQNAILNNGLNAGATIVLQRRFELAATLDTIIRQRITMFFGVPTVYIKLLDLHTPAAVLRRVRYFFVAGAKMPVEIARRWQERYSQPVYEGYGLTETSPFASYNHQHSYRLSSIGRAIEGVTIEIVDADGQPVAPGECGEIVIRGPNVMLGYWNRPLETAAVLRAGWFHSGDIGSKDEDGYLYVVDRLKDMINVSGFKVYPAEVEQVLYQHPAVAEAAVYGQPDPLKGEQVKASVMIRSGYDGGPEEIIAFCRSRIATFKVPEQIEFVTALPKNPSGKILKRLLRSESVRAAPSRDS